ncbi:MAG: hypothetical protein GC206_15525 [Alphaproteobacteria bacterium]|nr:hypothetical protein [Alphaproteobacteria bacterium]
MLRPVLCAALLVVVAACDRAQNQSGGTAPEPPSAETACNDVAINPAVSVTPGPSVAAAADEGLLGGPITPGVYDLARVEQRNGAREWTEETWRSVRVADSEAGQTLDFVTARGSADADPERFSARLREEPAGLIFTCGRTGEAPTAWSASNAGLQLQMPAEAGAGETVHFFQRRAR